MHHRLIASQRFQAVSLMCCDSPKNGSGAYTSK
ncbi:Hypothetical protein NGAL_HAMBI1145_60060 [Neorhizobium galegae bv. officinalis]|uniref:Uncharacterized protein n=1 Tax=Neorhizobium galegae bv. officinalis TaxID=323656 RepID=A0A0T7G335_NEOGA|nr:Hypothetical protein NGAL_HAMBI1145_60060 [Neorhizobium galegae bv. officinalis]